MKPFELVMYVLMCIVFAILLGIMIIDSMPAKGPGGPRQPKAAGKRRGRAGARRV
jgi:hypothetical protein